MYILIIANNRAKHKFLIFFHSLEHENSVDCISANPRNPNEFATGSHDKSIKIWDASR